MVKKLFLIGVIGISTMFTMHGMKAEKKELIFGGYLWDKKDRWYPGTNKTVFDLSCPGNAECIKADFNSANALKTKLADGAYDLIRFDVDSARYMEWNEEILRIISQKLKKGGELILDFELHPLMCFDLQDKIFDSYEQFKEAMDGYLKNNPDGIINGLKCYRMSKKSWEDFYARYKKEDSSSSKPLKEQTNQIYRHNEKILKKVFSKVAFFPSGTGLKFFLGADAPIYRPYYRATK